ncbi:regulator of chromosome condensation (RCC1) repeat-containing protein [Besnoitia besnoiti]|uniref:Regulator of chromosome condensation (RCC1) repeat-containing protein n=1 Tax=Besnoitia besnoiti TaxID=94643 RepID=A0A2A9MKB3_BESBE|nr:regulator of chromosome condensation (RCC1) repeat-containing protein [Besnoitia besnoiti]PFH36113.1 regulator of chromosome condensation (RCC1) repeat-containing protein [Besnoitia besnoiti]
MLLCPSISSIKTDSGGLPLVLSPQGSMQEAGDMKNWPVLAFESHVKTFATSDVVNTGSVAGSGSSADDALNSQTQDSAKLNAASMADSVPVESPDSSVPPPAGESDSEKQTPKILQPSTAIVNTAFSSAGAWAAQSAGPLHFLQPVRPQALVDALLPQQPLCAPILVQNLATCGAVQSSLAAETHMHPTATDSWHSPVCDEPSGALQISRELPPSAKGSALDFGLPLRNFATVNEVAVGPNKPGGAMEPAYADEDEDELGSCVYVWSTNFQRNSDETTAQGSQRITLPQPNKFSSYLRILSVACGQSLAAFIAADGKIYCWDWDLTTGDLHASSPQLLEGGNIEKLTITQVSCGANHLACITDNGRVFTYGSNERGQRGMADDSSSSRLAGEIFFSSRAKQVSCGPRYTLVVMEDGRLYGMGDGEHGVLGNDTDKVVRIPTKIDFQDRRVSFVAAGANHALAITDLGSTYAWGRNDCGQLGLGHTDDRWTPQVVCELSGHKTVFVAAQAASVALTKEKKLFAWGTTSLLSPTMVFSQAFRDVALGDALFCLSDEGGEQSVLVTPLSELRSATSTSSCTRVSASGVTQLSAAPGVLLAVGPPTDDGDDSQAAKQVEDCAAALSWPSTAAGPTAGGSAEAFLGSPVRALSSEQPLPLKSALRRFSEGYHTSASRSSSLSSERSRKRVTFADTVSMLCIEQQPQRDSCEASPPAASGASAERTANPVKNASKRVAAAASASCGQRQKTADTKPRARSASPAPRSAGKRVSASASLASRQQMPCLRAAKAASNAAVANSAGDVDSKASKGNKKQTHSTSGTSTGKSTATSERQGNAEASCHQVETKSQLRRSLEGALSLLHAVTAKAAESGPRPRDASSVVPATSGLTPTAGQPGCPAPTGESKKAEKPVAMAADDELSGATTADDALTPSGGSTPEFGCVNSVYVGGSPMPSNNPLGSAAGAPTGAVGGLPGSRTATAGCAMGTPVPQPTLAGHAGSHLVGPLLHGACSQQAALQSLRTPLQYESAALPQAPQGASHTPSVPSVPEASPTPAAAPRVVPTVGAQSELEATQQLSDDLASAFAQPQQRLSAVGTPTPDVPPFRLSVQQPDEQHSVGSHAPFAPVPLGGQLSGMFAANSPTEWSDRTGLVQGQPGARPLALGNMANPCGTTPGWAPSPNAPFPPNQNCFSHAEMLYRQRQLGSPFLPDPDFARLFDVSDMVKKQKEFREIRNALCVAREDMMEAEREKEELRRELREAKTALKDANAKIARSTEAQGILERAVAVQKKRIQSLQDELDEEAQQNHKDLTQVLQKLTFAEQEKTKIALSLAAAQESIQSLQKHKSTQERLEREAAALRQQLRNQKEEQAQQMKQAEEAIGEWRDSHTKLQEALEEAELGRKTEVSELQTEIDRLQAQAKEMEEETKRLREQADDATQSRLQSERQRRAAAEEKLDELEVAMNELAADFAASKRSNTRQKRELDGLAEEKKRALEENEDLRDELQRARDEAAKQETLLGELRTEIRELQTTVSGAEAAKTQHLQAIERLEEKVEELTEELSCCKEALADKQDELQRIGKLPADSSLGAEDHPCRECSSLTTQLNLVSDQRDKMNAQVEALQSDLGAHQNAAREQQVAIHELQMELSLVKQRQGNELKSLAEQRSQMEEKLRDVEAVKEELEGNLASLQEEVGSLRKDEEERRIKERVVLSQLDQLFQVLRHHRDLEAPARAQGDGEPQNGPEAAFTEFLALAEAKATTPWSFEEVHSVCEKWNIALFVDTELHIIREKLFDLMRKERELKSRLAEVNESQEKELEAQQRIEELEAKLRRTQQDAERSEKKMQEAQQAGNWSTARFLEQQKYFEMELGITKRRLTECRTEVHQLRTRNSALLLDLTKQEERIANLIKQNERLAARRRQVRSETVDRSPTTSTTSGCSVEHGSSTPAFPLKGALEEDASSRLALAGELSSAGRRSGDSRGARLEPAFVQ